ncbi:hypothetical protein ACJ72_07517 [Emergomyces africanus]|uniref:Protein PBN1 n=1 Tax=Emergomyces africanus TaxID=1955775 RepID=A0A1B7NMZ1_9EURO|nr:hypothetical protein ACJ72_07517 [Emergomyces africanus]
MRERITFIHEAEGEFNPDQVTVKADSLSIKALNAARQERVTFAYNELPKEIWQVLNQCRELRIRWSSQYAYDAVPPLASRVSPGLHVLYTPADQSRPATLLCPLLRKVFDDNLKCYIPETSFISPPILARKFTANPPLQFHQLLPSLAELVTYITQKICRQLEDKDTDTCQSRATLLLSADSLDVDYDNTSQTLTATGYWSKPPHKAGWSETIHKPKRDTDKVEVGILALERAIEPEELSVGGFLAVVGADEKLKPALFSFPSRHHPLPHSSKYTITFPHPTGLHPTLQLLIPRSSLTGPPPRAPPDTKCALHTYLTLPSSLFADKYQLSTTDPLFLQSHNLVSLRAIAGETDLEAPDWVTHSWGSSLLLELATPSSPSHETRNANANDGNDNDNDWQITVPLHLRYLPPSPSGYRNISVPWPTVFWACAAEYDEEEVVAGKAAAGINPFDRVGLGWDGLFAPGTLFYHLHPDAYAEPVESVGAEADRGMMVEKIQVPVLKIFPAASAGGGGGLFESVHSIEMVTSIVVIFGFLWVCMSLGKVVKERGIGNGDERRGLEASKKRQ